MNNEQQDLRYASCLGQVYGQEAANDATNDHDGEELTTDEVLAYDRDVWLHANQGTGGVAVPAENVPDVALAFRSLALDDRWLWSAFEDGVRDGVESWLDEADRAGAYDDEDDA